MRAFRYTLTAVLAALALGCRSDRPAAPLVLLDNVPEPQFVIPEERQATDIYDELYEQIPQATQEGTKFVSADDARRCPKIKVMTDQEEDIELQPGVGGSVTLVVFWSMEWPSAKAAARHIGDLQRKYRQWRVQAAGVVMNTPKAGLAHGFAAAQGIEYTLYLDKDQSALKKMAKAADAEEPRSVPAIFILDRQQRLRFYRPGFAFMMGARDPMAMMRGDPKKTISPGERPVLETAPPGQAIEDYLRLILSEG